MSCFLKTCYQQFMFINFICSLKVINCFVYLKGASGLVSAGTNGPEHCSYRNLYCPPSKNVAVNFCSQHLVEGLFITIQYLYLSV